MLVSTYAVCTQSLREAYAKKHIFYHFFFFKVLDDKGHCISFLWGWIFKTYLFTVQSSCLLVTVELLLKSKVLKDNNQKLVLSAPRAEPSVERQWKQEAPWDPKACLVLLHFLFALLSEDAFLPCNTTWDLWYKAAWAMMTHIIK